jgi:hypothetical protein
MMQGQLEFFKIDVVTGETETFCVVKNTILDSMYQTLVHLFGGAGASAAIDRIQLGTGTLAADPSQTFLQSPITPIKTVASEIDLGDSYTVVFTAYLEDDEGNGFPISEAGLLTKDDTLVTRTTFTARTKTSSYRFGFRWSIKVK